MFLTVIMSFIVFMVQDRHGELILPPKNCRAAVGGPDHYARLQPDKERVEEKTSVKAIDARSTRSLYLQRGKRLRGESAMREMKNSGTHIER